MADAADRMSGPALLTASAATQFTVTTGQTWTMKHIRVHNQKKVWVNFTLSLGSDAAGTRLWDAVPIPPKGELEWEGGIPVRGDEIVQAFGSLASALNLTVSGVKTS